MIVRPGTVALLAHAKGWAWCLAQTSSIEGLYLCVASASKQVTDKG